MSLTIQSIYGWEILDSRGRPTLAVEATLSDGATGTAQVPSTPAPGLRWELSECRKVTLELDALADQPYCHLTTVGRTTGLERTIEISPDGS